MIRDTTYLFLRSLKRVGVDTVTFLAVESNGIDVPPMRIYIYIYAYAKAKSGDNTNASMPMP